MSIILSRIALVIVTILTILSFPKQVAATGPSSVPTLQPTYKMPTGQPSSRPTISPTTSVPTSGPTISPTNSVPSSRPTSIPTTSVPSSRPMSSPTRWPTTTAPTWVGATNKPSNSYLLPAIFHPIPTIFPTSNPTIFPTSVPTTGPTIASASMDAVDSSLGWYNWYKRNPFSLGCIIIYILIIAICIWKLKQTKQPPKQPICEQCEHDVTRECGEDFTTGSNHNRHAIIEVTEIPVAKLLTKPIHKYQRECNNGAIAVAYEIPSAPPLATAV
jgi:hypothetical protein